MMKRITERMNPSQKRMAMAGLAIGGLVTAISLMSYMSSGDDKRRTKDQEVISHVFSDRDTREVTFESLSTQLKAAKGRNDRLAEEVRNLRSDMERASSSGVSTSVSRELDSLAREMDVLREQNRELREVGVGQGAPREIDSSQEADSQELSYSREDDEDESDKKDSRESAKKPSATESASRERGRRQDFSDDTSVDAESVFNRPPAPSRRRQTQASPEGDDDADSAPRGLKIISYYESVSSKENDTKEEDVPYIPAASIVSGVLLNGMDAPTSQGSRRDPVPATLRVKHEAILPNRFTADIKECHAIVSGHGDLSTERAALRTEVLSCLRDDGEVIEAPIEGYVVGTDGKTGIRGRLVSKQGALIARSMVAGFFSGASQALDVSPVPVIETSSSGRGGRTQYESNYSPKMLQGAGAQGASNALDRVAQFYVEMAEEIFPVVEVNAGTEVDIVLTSGVELRTRKAKQQIANARQNSEAKKSAQ